jgi:hypothetical protein
VRKVTVHNFGKNYKKTKKTMWENTVAIYDVLKIIIRKLNSQPAQY